MPGMTLKEMSTLPWTWQGPTHVADEDGERWELTIAELPDFFLAGANRDEVLAEAGAALRAYLRTYVDRNETPRLPTPRGAWSATVYAIQHRCWVLRECRYRGDLADPD